MPPHADASQQDRREFARTPVQMTAWCRPLEHEDSPLRLQEEWALAGPEIPAQEALEKARLPEGLAGFLLHLDAKLDALLGFLLHDKLARSFSGTLRVLELSGSGVQAQSTQPLASGTLLEVAILLQHAPVRMAGAVARVVREEPAPPHAAEDGKVYSIEFVRIQESALEAIVQFVFHEERKRLRERSRDR
ncbi:PilZ domain-containing protein [Megalodesulfovibrio paquesii]